MKFIRKIVKDANTIVFLDFEATESTMEIISIGAVKAELDSKKQIKSYDKGFKCYVYTDTLITPFIEENTSVTLLLFISLHMEIMISVYFILTQKITKCQKIT